LKLGGILESVDGKDGLAGAKSQPVMDVGPSRPVDLRIVVIMEGVESCNFSLFILPGNCLPYSVERELK
jgi:hypothetical protein